MLTVPYGVILATISFFYSQYRNSRHSLYTVIVLQTPQLSMLSMIYLRSRANIEQVAPDMAPRRQPHSNFSGPTLIGPFAE